MANESGTKIQFKPDGEFVLLLFKIARVCSFFAVWYKCVGVIKTQENYGMNMLFLSLIRFILFYYSYNSILLLMTFNYPFDLDNPMSQERCAVIQGTPSQIERATNMIWDLVQRSNGNAQQDMCLMHVPANKTGLVIGKNGDT